MSGASTPVFLSCTLTAPNILKCHGLHRVIVSGTPREAVIFLRANHLILGDFLLIIYYFSDFLAFPGHCSFHKFVALAISASKGLQSRSGSAPGLQESRHTPGLPIRLVTWHPFPSSYVPSFLRSAVQSIITPNAWEGSYRSALKAASPNGAEHAEAPFVLTSTTT